jgi:holo-[acyl-carrier protein] synthase
VIVGSGVDIIETGRLERELAHAPWQAMHGIFTTDEIHCFNISKKPALLFAGCFAAKEATLKALGMAVSNLAHFRDIEVLPDPDGNWNLSLHGYTLSISHKLGALHASVAVTTSTKLSVAMVVLEA